MALDPMYSKLRVAQKIKELRSDMSLTQKEFAEAIGAPESQSQVSLWESGKVLPQPDTLRRMAQVAGKGMDYFQEDEGRFEGAGAVGYLLIEIADQFTNHGFSQEEVVSILNEIVEAATEEDSVIGLTDSVAWDSYLRGLGYYFRDPVRPAGKDEEGVSTGRPGPPEGGPSPAARGAVAAARRKGRGARPQKPGKEG